LKKQILTVMLVVILGAPLSAFGIEPLDALKTPVDQVLALLQDPQYQDQDTDRKESQMEQIWDIIRKVFEFREIAKRTLARNWKKFTPQQKEAFTDHFAELLGNTYIGRIQGNYENEKVVFEGQKIINASKARVKTKILRGNIDIPMTYSMLKRKDVWKIYDVNIEGVSMLKNYRSQFNRILSKDSPDALIERLKKKNESLKKKRAKKE